MQCSGLLVNSQYSSIKICYNEVWNRTLQKKKNRQNSYTDIREHLFPWIIFIQTKIHTPNPKLLTSLNILRMHASRVPKSTCLRFPLSPVNSSWHCYHAGIVSQGRSFGFIEPNQPVRVSPQCLILSTIVYINIILVFRWVGGIALFSRQSVNSKPAIVWTSEMRSSGSVLTFALHFVVLERYLEAIKILLNVSAPVVFQFCLCQRHANSARVQWSASTYNRSRDR